MPDAARTPRLARLHVGLALAVVLCSTAFFVEVLRALGGNTLSWAYVFEWPLLLAYGVYMWQRLVREERSAASATADPTVPRATGDGTPDEDHDEDAVARAAYNQYLAELHAADAPTRRADRGPTPAP